MLREHFPWMTAEEEAWLRGELMRRAALGFEQAELWRDAAECWAALGEHARAGELYARGEDLGAAASALLGAGHYAQALELYRRWEASLAEGDIVNRVQALLGQAACHHLGARQSRPDDALSTQAGREAYRQALALIEAQDEGHPLDVGRCWAALGGYGARLGRHDLVQMGYEGALERLEAATVADRDKLAVGQAYLKALRAQDDQLLARALGERLAEWGELDVAGEAYQPPSYEELVARSQHIRPL